MARRKKQNEEDKPNENINESDDAFGLPEIEYEPLNRTEEKQETTSESSYSEPEPVDPEPVESEQHPSFEHREEPEPIHEEMIEEERHYMYTPPRDEEPPIWPKILGVIVILALIGVGGWYFFMYKPAQDDAERERIELARKAEAARVEKERVAEAERQRILAEEQRVADSLANAQPKEGLIETLSERTGRYYVVVASAVDDDLLMDYANKLKENGVSSKIIPPFRGVKFYRLAVADGDTYADAQTTADGLKGEYGEGVWVIRY